MSLISERRCFPEAWMSFRVGEKLRFVLAGASSCRLLSSISWNRRAFWMASADCVAKVRSSSMTSDENSPGVFLKTVRLPSR
jgi:hypothetical protein